MACEPCPLSDASGRIAIDQPVVTVGSVKLSDQSRMPGSFIGEIFEYAWVARLARLLTTGSAVGSTSRREFASAVSTTRPGDATRSKSEDAAEVQLSSCPGAQPIQSGAPSRHEASLQAEALCRLGRVARCRDIDRRSRDGGRAAWRRASITLTPPRVSVRRGVYAGVIVSTSTAALRTAFCTRKTNTRHLHPPLSKRLDARRSPTVSAVRRACPTWRLEPRVRSLSARIAANAALIAVSNAPTETISIANPRRVRHKHWSEHPVWRPRNLGNRIQPNSPAPLAALRRLMRRRYWPSLTLVCESASAGPANAASTSPTAIERLILSSGFCCAF
jgi:hypothetical protein